MYLSWSKILVYPWIQDQWRARHATAVTLRLTNLLRVTPTTSLCFPSELRIDQPFSELNQNTVTKLCQKERVSHEPVAQRVSHEPVPERVSHEPVAQRVSHEPVTERVSHEPVTERVSHKPVAESVSHEPVAELISHEPVAERISHEPVPVRVSHELVAEFKSR
jgi:hypothetical protein